MKRILILISFAFQFIAIFAQTDKLICEEKYLPAKFNFDFLNDTINYRHVPLGNNRYSCYRKGIDTDWHCDYSRIYVKEEPETYQNKRFDTPFIKDLIVYNKYGKYEVPYYDGVQSFLLDFYINDYYSTYEIKDNRVNGCDIFSWYIHDPFYRSLIGCELDKSGKRNTGFMNNARKGYCVYQYRNDKLFAKGRYSGEYLKIDTSKDGRYLLYYDNFGNQTFQESNTKKAMDSLKSKYDIYRFDFTFPILVEFRDGLWEFSNEDGTRDRKIWYDKGKEIKIELSK